MKAVIPTFFKLPVLLMAFQRAGKQKNPNTYPDGGQHEIAKSRRFLLASVHLPVYSCLINFRRPSAISGSLGAMCRSPIEHLCLIIFFSFSFFCQRSLKQNQRNIPSSLYNLSFAILIYFSFSSIPM